MEISEFSDASQLVIKDLCNKFGYSADEFPEVFDYIVQETAKKELAIAQWFLDISSICISIVIIFFIILIVKHFKIVSLVEDYIKAVFVRIRKLNKRDIEDIEDITDYAHTYDLRAISKVLDPRNITVKKILNLKNLAHL